MRGMCVHRQVCVCRRAHLSACVRSCVRACVCKCVSCMRVYVLACVREQAERLEALLILLSLRYLLAPPHTHTPRA